MKRFLSVVILVLLQAMIWSPLSFSKELDKKTWQEMAEDYDYPPPKNKKKPDPPKKDHKVEEYKYEPKISKPNIGNVLLYLGIAAAFITLIVILVRTGVIQIGSSKNTKLRKTFDEDNPEELELTELEKELQLAMQTGNYNRCLRYEFLLLLEKLQSLGLIKWHRYNTNGEYLRQLRQHKRYRDIRELTIIYEYYWYGEHELPRADYEKLSVIYAKLKEGLSNE